MTNIYFMMNLLYIGFVILIVLAIIISVKILLILDLNSRIDDPTKAVILSLMIPASIITLSFLGYLYLAYHILGPNNFSQWYNFIYIIKI